LQTQVDIAPVSGVYRTIPLKGILYWDLHAFNVTAAPHTLHGRMNVFYTDDLRYQQMGIIAGEFGPSGIAPFTKQDVCKTYVAPQGSRIIRLTSHTHKRGEHFWVSDAQANKIYESYLYSDPSNLVFDPPMAFASADSAQRTLTYCGTFNNGVDPNGAPDVNRVARLSRIPSTAQGRIGSTCVPVACVAGNVGAPCSGASDNAACDSAPGAGDGLCDACPTTGGETTENEMFFMLGDTILAPSVGADAGDSGGANEAGAD
jgi:hypothetical protein